MTTLERVKSVKGFSDTSKDALLTVLIEDAEAEFMDSCNRADVPEKAQSLIAQMVVFRFNQLGSEGLASTSYSGVSESYQTDYPQFIRSQMNQYRKLRMM